MVKKPSHRLNVIALVCLDHSGRSILFKLKYFSFITSIALSTLVGLSLNPSFRISPKSIETVTGDADDDP